METETQTKPETGGSGDGAGCRGRKWEMRPGEEETGKEEMGNHTYIPYRIGVTALLLLIPIETFVKVMCLMNWKAH